MKKIFSMKKNFSMILVALLILFMSFISLTFLTACVADSPPQILGVPRFTRETPAGETYEAYYEANPTPQPFTVFHKHENVQFAKYEPAEGIYLAAWLMPEMSVRMFEQQTGKRHAAYVYEINLGDEVPASWVLQNIAALSAPIFIIHPPTNPELEDIPQTQLAVYLAQQLGAFNLPMFATFYPDDRQSSAEFNIFFRHARNVFHTYAPMVAFVWVAPGHTATPGHASYPGHAFVDWVALPLFSSWSAENGFRDVLQNFDTFYRSFSPHKPVMILPLGVSHFTRGDYTYRVHEAAAEISGLYAALKNFPRLGLIAYGDAFSLIRADTDDFSVTKERTLTQAYVAAITYEHFLSGLQRDHNAAARWVRSVSHGYVYEDYIFISHETLRELSIAPSFPATHINGKAFKNSVELEKLIRICPSRQVIFVENAP